MLKALNQMNKILITGGAGCLGSNLVDHLIPLGFQVCVIDNYTTGNKESLPLSNENIKNAYNKISNNIGKELLVGNWETIDQDKINSFAEVTGDKQWIHTDMEKAKKQSPFKTTIAHGFLTLSLIPKLTEAFDFNSIHPGLKMVVNCGLNQVRFPFPVKSGSKIRGRVKIISVVPKKNNIELINEVSIEVEGRKRFGCVAETVLRLYC